MRRRRRNPAVPVQAISVFEQAAARRRRRRSGNGGLDIGTLALYGVAAYLLYQSWTPAAPASASAPAPAYFVRSEDGQVIASHTGPPSALTWAGGWGTWTPATAAQVQAAQAAGDLVTIS
jgi:hypothetical protein